nr:MAG TPA: Cytosine specific methyltransferase [Caudoviricetes sp.]
MMTLGSLFSGSGGFELGATLAKIKPVWNSEIEPFQIRVTTKRLPQVNHYGDIRKLNGHDMEPVDIITFGSPCTDMSVAGKRKGLDGKQSGLFHEAIRVIKEMREATNGVNPRFIVWENVTGAFSSNGGEDFRTVLEEICRVKDAEISLPRPQKWQRGGTSWVTGFPSLGGCLTPNTGESPREGNVSTLSEILVAEAPARYSLSQRACLGILRRCSERGKVLPDPLREAVKRQACMRITERTPDTRDR